jgi:hypothetical protein
MLSRASRKSFVFHPAKDSAMSHDAVSRFWENFVEKTKVYNLKPSAVRWHVAHAREYIQAHSGRRLAGHKAEDIVAYLRGKGRNGRLADWQYAQVVRALQILFVEMVQAPWAGTPHTERLMRVKKYIRRNALRYCALLVLV